MVVTRRQSTTPMPAVASRTNSSAGSSRLGKAKVDKSSSLKTVAGPSHNTPNGAPSKSSTVNQQTPEDVVNDDNPQTSPPPNVAAPKPKSKSKIKKPEAKKHRQHKGIITVCPEDVELRSPLCYALTEYRRLVLEPYVYPTVRTALQHPSVAPTVQRIQPYYNVAIKTTVPFVRRIKYEWRTRIIPQVRWFQIRARPYMRQVQRKYDATLHPYVRRAYLEYHNKVEPYVRIMKQTAYQKWMATRPYVHPLWRSAQRLPGIVIHRAGKPLGDARRRWVDPHLAKIWDVVMEREKANISNAKTSAESITTATGWTPFSASTSTGENSLAATDDPSSVIPPTPEISKEVTSSSTVSDEGSASTDPALSPYSRQDAQDAPSEPLPTPIVILDDAEALVGVASSGEATLPAITNEPAASAAMVIEESLFPSTTPPFVVVETGVASEDEDEGTDVNLDDFLSEISAMEFNLQTEQEPEQLAPAEPPVYVEETQEQLEERLRLKSIEVADKRAEIEGRHAQWELNLEKFGNAQIEVVRAALTQLRKASVAEAQNPASVVRLEVEDLTKEAEKSLKSLKAYAKKLAADEGLTESEKIRTWMDVMSKVDKKFGQKVDSTAEAVRTWWDWQVQKELEKIQTISSQVRQVALDAQSDLGMDYAWLGDVTYLDWQRYHKLVATSDSFEAIYLRMQNSTDENAPPNSLNDVMEALQVEVDEMIYGFETNLSRARRDALDLFAGSGTTSDTTSEVPEVSILPIEPVPFGKADSIPPIILSRGAEEVEGAIKRAEEAMAINHEEL